MAQDMDWWRGAVTSQIDPRCFQAWDGDGIGDLPGITQRLDHVAAPEVDAIWLSPFSPSPMNDMGSDIADYRGIDPLFGRMADFDRNAILRGVAGLNKGRLIAVLPVGAIEQHGPHLPVSVDQPILDGIIRATLSLMPSDLSALCPPTLPIGKSDEHSGYPGTLTLSAATLMATWADIGDSVARAGVRKLILLNAHGGQMDIVVREMRRRHGMIAVAASWFAMGLPAGLFSPQAYRFGIHADDVDRLPLSFLFHPANLDALR